MPDPELDVDVPDEPIDDEPLPEESESDGPIEIAEVRPSKNRYRLSEVAEALRASAGIKSLAARRLGCERRTINRYIARSKALLRIIQEIDDETKDLCEATLAAALLAERKLAEVAAREGTACAIPNHHFYLRTKARDRGYSTASELSGPFGGPIATEHSPDLSKLSDDELRQYRELMLRAR